MTLQPLHNSAAAEEAYWNGLRHELMLDPTVTYLNNGSQGPCARVVFDVVVEYMRQIQSQPCQQLWFEIPKEVRVSKENLGDYVGADPDHFAMVMNLTIGMNMVVNGLDIESGAEILTTDQEYGAVNNCWESMAEQKGWKIKRVKIPTPPENAEQIIGAIAGGITPKTRILLFSHITTTTGLIMPAKRLAAMAREHGFLSVIDGAHAPGMIPLNVEDVDADFYIGNCHKWLMGPTGTAFLHVRPEVQEQLRPSVIGWGMSFGKRKSLINRVLKSRKRTSENESPELPPYMYRLFEFLGTRDLAPFAGVGAAVDFQRGIGLDRITARGRRLAGYLRAQLRERIPEAKLLTPDHEELSGSLTAFTMPSIGDGELMQELWQRYRMQIVGRQTEDDPKLTRCRIATHYYNSYTEIDRFFDVLDALRSEQEAH